MAYGKTAPSVGDVRRQSLRNRDIRNGGHRKRGWVVICDT
jgi:hypothetical protein